MDADVLQEISRTFGTPCYVFDVDALASRMRRIRDTIPSSVKLCYSIKANPFLLRPMMDFVEKYEVCSPGELTVCEKARVPMNNVIFSGVYKSREDVFHALADGVHIFTAESPGQALLVDECAGVHGTRVALYPRLTNGSQFGMGKKALFSLLEGRGRLVNVDVSGIHFFSGTQKKRMKVVLSELEMIADLLWEIESVFGFHVENVEYGPGFGVPYFTNDSDGDMQLLLDSVPAFCELSKQYGLTIEMGRYFTAFCGHYLTRVVDVKHDGDVSYAIVDGGTHHMVYNGQMMGMRIPHLRNLSGNPSGESRLWTICGSLCTMSDVLVKSVEMPLRQGDVIDFERVGAYSVTEGLSLFLSRDLPRVIFHRDGKTALARDAFRTTDVNIPLEE